MGLVVAMGLHLTQYSGVSSGAFRGPFDIRDQIQATHGQSMCSSPFINFFLPSSGSWHLGLAGYKCLGFGWGSSLSPFLPLGWGVYLWPWGLTLQVAILLAEQGLPSQKFQHKSKSTPGRNRPLMERGWNQVDTNCRWSVMPVSDLGRNPVCSMPLQLSCPCHQNSQKEGPPSCSFLAQGQEGDCRSTVAPVRAHAFHFTKMPEESLLQLNSSQELSSFWHQRKLQGVGVGG